MDLYSIPLFVAVGCLAVALVWGLGARFYYLFQRKEPPPYLAITLFSLIGIFGLVVGVQDLYEIRTSPVIHASGVLRQVVLTHGKGDHYWFTIVSNSGQYRLRTDYGGPGIQDGEIVEIEFLEKPGTLTYLRVLSPANHRDLVLHQGDGTGNAWFTLLIGLGAFVLVAFLLRGRQSANAIRPKSAVS